MALANVSAIIALVEGYLASEFDPDVYNRNQGSDLIPEFVSRIVTRADLANLTLYMYSGEGPPPGGAKLITDEPGVLVAVVAATNATATEDAAVLVYDSAAATVGTTKYIAALNVDAGGSTASGRMYYMVFPEPLPFSALSYAAVDNGSNTDVEGTTQTVEGGIKTLFVYAD